MSPSPDGPRCPGSRLRLLQTGSTLSSQNQGQPTPTSFHLFGFFRPAPTPGECCPVSVGLRMESRTHEIGLGVWHWKSTGDGGVALPSGTLLLHSVWTAFFDRCLVKLPTGEYVSPQHGGSWTLESSSLVHYPTTIIALNRTIKDGTIKLCKQAVLLPSQKNGWLREIGTLSIIGRINSAAVFTKICANTRPHKCVQWTALWTHILCDN